MGEWIDFKQLREQLDFADILARYGVSIKATAAGQHKSRCPLPTHPRDNTSLAFSANLKKKIWRCFGCNTSGNVLDFAVRMEGRNPKNPMDVREVALKLKDASHIPVQTPRTRSNMDRKQPPDPRVNSALSALQVNPPLDFALKNLSSDHAFFHKRHLLLATIEHFGLGYCTKGMFAGRIAIPLHNLEGQLVGYVGRLTDEFDVTEEQPIYLWPTERERNGVKHVFDRTKLLYHADLVPKPVDDLVIVQSPESAWWVWQAGFPNVVALLCNEPSLVQAKAIVEMTKPTGRVWFLTDGNKVGERCASNLFFDIGPSRFCTWPKLADGKPTDCSEYELREMLT